MRNYVLGARQPYGKPSRPVLTEPLIFRKVNVFCRFTHCFIFISSILSAFRAA